MHTIYKDMARRITLTVGIECSMMDSDRAHLQLNTAPVPLHSYNALYNHQIACIGTVYNVVDHCITRWYDIMSSNISFVP